MALSLIAIDASYVGARHFIIFGLRGDAPKHIRFGYLEISDASYNRATTWTGLRLSTNGVGGRRKSDEECSYAL